MSVVTLRYAHAFADVARSSGLDSTAARQQLRDFADTLIGSSELRDFLGNPSVPAPEKLRIVDAIAARIGVFPQVRNFIAVMMHNERLSEIDQILTEYAAVVDEQTSVFQAEITSARPLNEEDRAELERNIVKLAGGRVHSTFYEDPALLGGAVVRIGSTVYDGSVRTQLQQMKQRLINA